MLIAILGPTASGKSALAVAVALRVAGTVVNGDPYQAFAGFTIGTGQPSMEEQHGAPHVGYGAIPLGTRLNPVEFGALVRVWMAPHANPVLVTGSGLYLRGIWNQLTALPEVAPPLVEKLRRLGARLGPRRLHRYLQTVDPERAAELHPNDISRIQRALALHLATGGRPSELLTGIAPVPPGWKVLVVQPTRECQRKRVAARVEAQLQAGWRMEVQRLMDGGHRADLEALRPLGYDVLMEEGRAEAIARDRIVQTTQAYAKRQSTWFRNQLPGIPVWDPDAESLETAFEKLGI